MQMTSSRVPTSAAVLLVLALCAPLAFADQKDDLYKKGSDAAATDPFAARDAFCKLKDLDPTFKDAATQCTTYTQIADRTAFRYKTNFMDGMNALNSGDFATAETKFKNVKGGDYFDKAQQKLAELPGLKAKAQEAANAGAAAETANKQKLDQGTAAFNSGNMDAAESALSSVTGSRQAEAQSVLQKVRAYKAALAKGQAFEGAKDYQAAKNAYAEAVGINPVGPATSLMAKAAASANASVPTPTNAGNNPPPVVKPPTPAKQIDVNAYLAEAQKALAKKDYKKARRFLGDIFAQDRNNQEAKDILASVNGADTVAAKATDEDTLLLDIVKTYYAGSYQDAEDRLKVYIYNNQGKKKGLANFYLGAIMLTRYYLAGGSDQNLRREAQNKFKAAKDVDGFKAPDKFVSPKIMKAFEEAS